MQFFISATSIGITMFQMTQVKCQFCVYILTVANIFFFISLIPNVTYTVYIINDILVQCIITFWRLLICLRLFLIPLDLNSLADHVLISNSKSDLQSVSISTDYSDHNVMYAILIKKVFFRW